jgi:hypothetical protein
MAPGDIPQRCVGCFERIAVLETEAKDMRAEITDLKAAQAEKSKRNYEWTKTIATVVFTFMLSGGGLFAWLKSYAESKGWVK